MAQVAKFSWRRSLAWAVTLSLHTGVLLLLLMPAAYEAAQRTTSDTDELIPVSYIDSLATPLAPTRATSREAIAAIPGGPEMLRKPEPSDSPTMQGALPIDSLLATAAEAVADAPVARPNLYIDDDTRAVLPYEDLYAAAPPKRTGGYYTPGDGTEDDVFYRPLALEPNASAFAHAWKPGGSLLTDWLERAVSAAMGTVSIPLNPKFNLVCKSLLGVVGTCAIVRVVGTGVIVQRPPPPPWERSNRVQCRELREALENADNPAAVASALDSLTRLCVRPENDEARRGAGLR